MSEIPSSLTQSVFLVNEVVASDGAARAQAEGAAYQIIAQAAAAVVADAAETLRSINMVNLAAISTMTARMVESGDAATWGPAILEAQRATMQSSEIFKRAGENAAAVLLAFRREPSERETS